MATNFKFRFEKILDWYEKKQEEAKRKLAELRIRYMEEENKLKLIKEEKEYAERKFLENKDDISFGVVIRYYLERKREEIDIQKNKLRELDEMITQQREILLYWDIKKKSMEKLKEKDLMLYQLKLKQLENIILDENGTIRYLRRYENI
ncbi:MAG: flagellar export protein FliJ [bacterium]